MTIARTDGRLVQFLYILLRDHLPAGAVEGIMLNHVDKTAGLEITYSNHHLADYARELAARINTEARA